MDVYSKEFGLMAINYIGGPKLIVRVIRFLLMALISLVQIVDLTTVINLYLKLT